MSTRIQYSRTIPARRSLSSKDRFKLSRKPSRSALAFSMASQVRLNVKATGAVSPIRSAPVAHTILTLSPVSDQTGMRLSLEGDGEGVRNADLGVVSNGVGSLTKD